MLLWFEVASSLSGIPFGLSFYCGNFIVFSLLLVVMIFVATCSNDSIVLVLFTDSVSIFGRANCLTRIFV
jgi:hypothetical protein